MTLGAAALNACAITIDDDTPKISSSGGQAQGTSYFTVSSGCLTIRFEHKLYEYWSNKWAERDSSSFTVSPGTTGYAQTTWRTCFTTVGHNWKNVVPAYTSGKTATLPCGGSS